MNEVARAVRHPRVPARLEPREAHLRLRMCKHEHAREHARAHARVRVRVRVPGIVVWQVRVRVRLRLRLRVRGQAHVGLARLYHLVRALVSRRGSGWDKGRGSGSGSGSSAG